MVKSAPRAELMKGSVTVRLRIDRFHAGAESASDIVA
jgi:hypothetical protein